MNTTGKASTGSTNLLVHSASGGKFGTNTFSTVQADITTLWELTTRCKARSKGAFLTESLCS